MQKSDFVKIWSYWLFALRWRAMNGFIKYNLQFLFHKIIGTNAFIIWATFRIFDQVRLKPACSATEAS